MAKKRKMDTNWSFRSVAGKGRVYTLHWRICAASEVQEERNLNLKSITKLTIISCRAEQSLSTISDVPSVRSLCDPAMKRMQKHKKKLWWQFEYREEIGEEEYNNLIDCERIHRRTHVFGHRNGWWCWPGGGGRVGAAAAASPESKTNHANSQFQVN